MNQWKSASQHSLSKIWSYWFNFISFLKDWTGKCSSVLWFLQDIFTTPSLFCWLNEDRVILALWCTLIYTELIGCHPGVNELANESYHFASKTGRETKIQSYTITTGLSQCHSYCTTFIVLNQHWFFNLHRNHLEILLIWYSWYEQDLKFWLTNKFPDDADTSDPLTTSTATRLLYTVLLSKFSS